jgi:hypothetical protein
MLRNRRMENLHWVGAFFGAIGVCVVAFFGWLMDRSRQAAYTTTLAGYGARLVKLETETHDLVIENTRCRVENDVLKAEVIRLREEVVKTRMESRSLRRTLSRRLPHPEEKA